MISSAGGRSAWRAIVPFCVATVLLGPTIWFGFRDEVMGDALVALRSLTARVVVGALNGLGLEVAVAGTAVFHPSGFGMEISRGCTGFVGAALLTVALATYPADRYAKLVGLVVCPTAFLSLNLARLVTLFYLGVHRPDAFHVAHTIVWQGLMVGAVVGLWIAWLRWARPQEASWRRASTIGAWRSRSLTERNSWDTVPGVLKSSQLSACTTRGLPFHLFRHRFAPGGRPSRPGDR